MSARSKTATVAGVPFLITEVSAIAGLALYQPVLTDAGYVAGAGSDGRILLGVVCELILVVAVIGTAVTLFPVIKRQHEGIALGHVALRLLEAAVITVGMVSMVGQPLVAVHDWTFLLGPSVFLGLNSVLLAFLVHRARLVPRGITWLGLVGGPLVAMSAVAVILGAYGPVTHAISAVPVFAWEVSLAVYLISRGFRWEVPAGPESPDVTAAARRNALPPRPDAGGETVQLVMTGPALLGLWMGIYSGAVFGSRDRVPAAATGEPGQDTQP